MKKFILSYMCLLSISTTLAYGTTEWASLVEYNADMEKQGKPKILIVGCGHSSEGLDGNHTHEDSWCVDIRDPENYEPSHHKNGGTNKQSKNHFESIKPNEEIDITAKYNLKSSFDMVVLERNWEKTLHNPRTLYNAARMLKDGGQLWVDIHHTYDMDYSKIRGNIYSQNWIGEASLEEEIASQQMLDNAWIEDFYGSSWKDCLNTVKDSYDGVFNDFSIIENKFDALRKTLPNYGIDYKVNTSDPVIQRAHPGLKAIGKHLVDWYFTDIIIANEGIQPFCNRKGQFLVAKKTKFTNQHEKSWLQSIIEFEKLK